ncbi:CtsR family transcriptional regulator [Anaerosinus massiliensis]|uniref:CtsR family transcriptional regulator n=1 Tax=Massilibacillus massiliensis TaxID=1806837 RepID=UPI000AC33FF5|nr:CtsR family transcriptional regulator [Massilibacillus massiliensis]
MSNIADLIEEYILRRLSREQDSKVELRRTEIADEIDCAPSQISYVLNTRFTIAKGFTVESRRGLGGFIRITRVPLQNIIYQDILNKINEETSLEDIKVIVRYLVQHGFIANREAAILFQVVPFIFAKMEEKERIDFLHTIFLTLANFS